MIFALDSNIITYILKGDADVIKSYRQSSALGNRVTIPPIVYYEIARWLVVKQSRRLSESFADLCARINYVEFDRVVWRKAADIYADLRKNGIIIEDSDIFIAAFCIVNGYTLVTNNARHFARIDGLEFVNWKEQSERNLGCL